MLATLRLHWPLAVLALLISAATVVLISAGTAIFVHDQGLEDIPIAYAALAAGCIVIALASGRLLSAGKEKSLTLIILAASGGLVLAHWVAYWAGVAMTPTGMYIFGYVFEIVIDSVYWLLAIRVVGAAGLTAAIPVLAALFPIGGALGAGIAAGLLELFPVDTTFAAAVLLLLPGALLLPRMRLAADAAEPEEDAPVIDVAGRTRLGKAYVGALGASLLMMAMLLYLQDYLVIEVVSQRFTDENVMGQVFAGLHGAAQAIELAILVLLGKALLDRAGTLSQNLAFPVSTLVTFLGALVVGPLAAAAVHVNIHGISNGVYEPVKTVNFALIPGRRAAQLRMTGDCIVYPIGVAIAAYLISAVAGWPIGERMMLVLGLILAFAAVSVAVGVLKSRLDAGLTQVAVPGLSRRARAMLLGATEPGLPLRAAA